MEATAIFFSRVVSLRYSWSRRLSSPVSSGSSCSSTEEEGPWSMVTALCPGSGPAPTLQDPGKQGPEDGAQGNRETSEALTQLSQRWPPASLGRALLS